MNFTIWVTTSFFPALLQFIVKPFFKFSFQERKYVGMKLIKSLQTGFISPLSTGTQLIHHSFDVLLGTLNAVRPDIQPRSNPEPSSSRIEIRHVAIRHSQIVPPPAATIW